MWSRPINQGTGLPGLRLSPATVSKFGSQGKELAFGNGVCRGQSGRNIIILFIRLLYYCDYKTKNQVKNKDVSKLLWWFILTVKEISSQAILIVSLGHISSNQN